MSGEQGQFDYPDADEVLVLCDGGGSNSSSAYIFKEDLQALSNRLGQPFEGVICVSEIGV